MLLIDVRTDVFAYLSGHLPGAEYLNTETIRASRGGIPTQLLEPEAYAALFSRLGVRMDQPVVIYSAGETHNIDATFLAWLLAGFGHPAVYVLDGGYFKWQLEQRPIARKYPRIPESRFPAGPFHPEAADLAAGPGRPRRRRPRCWSTPARPTSTPERRGRRCAEGTSRARSTITGRAT